MPTAENAQISYESGQSIVAMVALSDSGDHRKFNSADEIWSNRSGYKPTVRPNGVASGGAITPAAAAGNNNVDVAALVCYLAGVKTDVAADADVAAVRPTAGNIIITFAAGGYTSCVASDIGKKVTGTTTGDTGDLVSYNNVTRQWLLTPDVAGDTFANATEAVTIAGGGTGAGTMSIAGTAVSRKITSITVNSAGSVAAVAGFDGLTLSTTRGDLGGPPLIATTSIEVGQVKFSAAAAAVVSADEIFTVPGTHVEFYNFPGWTVDFVDVENGVMGLAGVTFDSALPLIHTGSVPKAVYAEYFEPAFTILSKTENFVPPETTHSVSSKQLYRKTIGSKTSSLGQGSFTAYLEDGISDPFLAVKNEELWFKFEIDPLEDHYILARGTLGIARTFPAGDQIAAACTISAEEAAVEVVG